MFELFDEIFRVFRLTFESGQISHMDFSRIHAIVRIHFHRHIPNSIKFSIVYSENKEKDMKKPPITDGNFKILF